MTRSIVAENTAPEIRIADVTMRQFAQRETAELLDTAAKAIRKAADDPTEEAVHKMRVSIRRFQQSLRLFGQFLRPKGVRQVRGDLKAIMTPAGELRNHDIAIGLVSQRSSAGRVLANRRQEAQAALSVVLHGLPDDLGNTWMDRLELDAK